MKKYNDIYYLQASPVKELDILYKNTNQYQNIEIEKEKTIQIPLADAAQFIRLKGKFEEKAVLELILFGRMIRIDFSENQIFVGKNKLPFSLTKKELDLAILVDRCGVEIFADGGTIYLYSLSKDMVMDRNLLSLILSCNTKYALDFAEIHALEPIWQTSPKIF